LNSKSQKINKEQLRHLSTTNINSLSRRERKKTFSMKDTLKYNKGDMECPYKDEGPSSNGIINCKCGQKFGFFTTKIRCNFCKDIHCKKCINPKKISLPLQFKPVDNSFGFAPRGPVSVCDDCFSYIRLLKKIK
jgi:hypothetical protein